MAEDVPASDTDSTLDIGRLARGLAPALLTVAAAVYSLMAVCSADSATATNAQWSTVAARVREARTPEELIVFAPSWIDPIGRQHLGDQMSIAMTARMDSARYAGIWEIGLNDERAPETRGLKSDASFTAGPLTVRHYVQTPAEVIYDFTSEWRAGKASGPMQGRPNLSLEEVGFEPHQCIKVVPRPGQTAIVTFSQIALGSKIVGFVGLADIFTRRDVREPGRLTLYVDGELRVTVTSGIDSGWKRFEAETTPGIRDVEFHLTAVGAGARDRRICFAAEARK